MQIFQLLAGSAGAALGFTYVVGGLIVNTHLSRYGVTEYQILRAKYLAVGLVYLLNITVNLIPAAIIALLLISLGQLATQLAGIAALLAAGWLLKLWSQRKIRRPFFSSWRLWVFLSVVSLVFPLMVIARLFLTGITTILDGVLVIEAVVLGLLAITTQVYFYAKFLYAQPTVFAGALDPTGMGAAVWAKLAGKQEEIAFLRQMGVPFESDELTGNVLLIDETESHYIIGLDTDDGTRAIKVNKDVIKAIQYLDYVIQAESQPPGRKHRRRHATSSDNPG